MAGGAGPSPIEGQGRRGRVGRKVFVPARGVRFDISRLQDQVHRRKLRSQTLKKSQGETLLQLRDVTASCWTGHMRCQPPL